MKVYNLPQDLLTDGQRLDGSVLMKLYNNPCSTIHNRIILQQNMINLLIKGSKTIVYAEETTTISNNEFLILSTGNCLTSELVPADGTFSSVLIYFSNEVLTRFLVRYQDLVQRPSKEEVRLPFLPYQQDDFIRNYIRSLTIMLSNGDRSCTPQFRLHKLEELLLYLLQQDPGKLNSLLAVSSDDDLRVRRAVESNTGRNITVDELAFLCNMSPSTFKRRFQSLYKTSPRKWFLAQKMKLAAELLKHPQERPGLVFQKLGYENHSSFSETFRQQYGMSPKDYQARFATPQATTLSD